MFRSFFLAGFDCTSAVNASGCRVDHLAATQHDRFLDEDYARVRAAGIRAVREGLPWSSIGRRGRYEFTWLDRVADASLRNGVDVIYDLCHFGYPDGVDPFAPEFTTRFGDYCYAVARRLAGRFDRLWLTPMNEPSYFAWAGGHAGLFAPHRRECAFDLKVALVRAAIAGIEAIWSVVPDARIVNVDPVCRTVAPVHRPDLQSHAERFNDVAVFESWDMLAGRLLPELGGSPRHLDIMGVNYYWTNQWEVGSEDTPLEDDDPRRWPLHRLLLDVVRRYGTDVILTETSHIGERRAGWIGELAIEIETLIRAGAPIRGACLYPILSMPDWHEPDRWLSMGLWDLVPEGDALRRVPHEPMLQAVRAASHLEGAQWRGHSPGGGAPSRSTRRW